MGVGVLLKRDLTRMKRRMFGTQNGMKDTTGKRGGGEGGWRVERKQ